MIEYCNKGFTGKVDNGRVIVHSPDGHLVTCRRTEIKTLDGLKMLVDYISEVL